jgi:hypothetical protein
MVDLQRIYYPSSLHLLIILHAYLEARKFALIHFGLFEKKKKKKKEMLNHFTSGSLSLNILFLQQRLDLIRCFFIKQHI